VPVQPYGSWPSQLGAEAVTRGLSRSLAAVWPQEGRLRWLEYRADEGGRGVVVQEGEAGAVVDVTPPGVNVRSRVHEYGGGACWLHGDTVFYSDFADSRLYRQDGVGAEPVAITPEPSAPHALRYADGCLVADGATVVCVRERHDGEDVHNELVALPADGSREPRTVFSGTDFVASPRPDPLGRSLAWITWDHPAMPWDATRLWLATLAPDGSLTDACVVAGAAGGESILQPAWSPDGTLHFCSDASGWWNLQRLDPDGEVRALTHLDDAEIGSPQWQFAMSSYAFLDDGRIACVVARAAVGSLALLEPDGRLEAQALEWTSYSPTAFAAGGGLLAYAAASPRSARALCVLDPNAGTERIVRRALETDLDPASISAPRAIEFDTGDGGVAHAFHYPPASADFQAPEGERAPLRVICHGGPTGHTDPVLSLVVQFFTQRGIAVLDVNHRGSSGFGRAYRDLLHGRWGEIDWRDCVAAARHLAEQGEADPDRTWIQGASAGGYVVMCALAFDPPAFAAGVSLFGVADLELLAHDTHKFEARYLDTLIGPYPERADLYRERSPIHRADAIERPMLVLQGSEDRVVPPSQSQAIVAALDRNEVAHAYIEFEGEGHGFRRAENIRRTLEAELAFVAQVFGLDPADELPALDIRHAPPDVSRRP
jgi:dipeptidyl aminopeptidase/acylaminoacyl peptidase